MRALRTRASRALDLRAVRFVLVGVLNTAFGYGLFAALLFIGLPYAWAAVVGTILAVLFNFQTLGKLVFADRDRTRLGRFITAYVLILVVSLVFLWFAERAHWNLYIASAAFTPFSAALSFGLQRTYVFPETR